MHISQNSTVQNFECTGSWKVTGCNHGNTSWHSGRVAFVSGPNGSWFCHVFLNQMQTPNKQIRLNSHRCCIKRVFARRRLMIDLSDGTSIHMNDLTPGQLAEVDKLLNSIKAGNAPSPGWKSSLAPLKTTPPPKCSTPDVSRSKRNSERSPANQFLPNSPSVLANVKNLVVPRSRTSDEELPKDDFEVVEEDYVKSEQQKKTPRRRLIEADDENMSPISKLSPGGFYGNQCSEPRPRSFSASVGNASAGKRRPGLMPLYPEVKRAKTALSPSSNVNYSWQKLPSTYGNLQGFSNLGNTCYMNAILQSLFTLDSFASDLIKLCLQAKRRSVDDDLGEKLFGCLGRLLSTRWRLYTTLEKRRTCLAAVKRAISSTARRFLGHEQHDAHEFLSLVLDQLKEEVIAMNKVSSEVSIAEEEWKSLVNPTSMNFEFEVLHIITCLSCKEQVTKTETFHDLSLDLPRKNGDVMRLPSLQESLDQFLRREFIEYTCPECKNNRAEVAHKFTRLPRVLVLHLKRYNFIAETSFSSKMGRAVSIPRFLTLQDHCVEDTLPSFPAPEPYKPNMQKERNCVKREDGSPTLNVSLQRSPPQIVVHPTTPTSSEKKKEHSSIFDEHRVKHMSGDGETMTDENNNDATKSQDLSGMSETKQVDFLLDYTRKQSEQDKQNLDEYSLGNLSEDEQLRLAMQQSIEQMNSGRHDNAIPASGNHDDNSDRVAAALCTKCGRRPYFLESVGQRLCDCPRTSDAVLSDKYAEADIFRSLCSNDAEMADDPLMSNGTGTEEEDKENRTPPPPPPVVDPLMDHSDWTDSQAMERAIANSLKDQEIRDYEQRKLNYTESKAAEDSPERDVTDDEACVSPRTQEEEELVCRNAETGELGYSYRLMSVVSHLGSSSSVGHYISDVCDLKKRAWFSYDDTEVSRLREAEVRERRQKTGYIFFYVGKDIVDDLCEWYEVNKDRVDKTCSH